jgi:hypothetical protein
MRSPVVEEPTVEEEALTGAQLREVGYGFSSEGWSSGVLAALDWLRQALDAVLRHYHWEALRSNPYWSGSCVGTSLPRRFGPYPPAGLPTPAADSIQPLGPDEGDASVKPPFAGTLLQMRGPAAELDFSHLNVPIPPAYLDGLAHAAGVLGREILLAAGPLAAPVPATDEAFAPPPGVEEPPPVQTPPPGKLDPESAAIAALYQYPGASMSEIAVIAGVSRQTLYTFEKFMTAAEVAGRYKPRKGAKGVVRPGFKDREGTIEAYADKEDDQDREE